jgi:outer membrane receptor protein involved in Fe transport
MPRSAWALLATALAAAPAAAQFPAEVRGRVTEAGSGAAVAGARVEADGASAAVRPDGSFLLRGVAPGTREVRVRAPGFREGRFTVEAANGRTAWLAAALERAPVTLEALRVRAPRDAAGATVLDRAAIEASGSRDLGEVLQGEAGVTVTRRGGPGSPAHLSIRGSSADEVLVLLDGVPLNSPLTGEVDLSAVPLEAVGRVTVLRGAQSARYGARALAGGGGGGDAPPAGRRGVAARGGGALGRGARGRVGGGAPRRPLRAGVGGGAAGRGRVRVPGPRLPRRGHRGAPQRRFPLPGRARQRARGAGRGRAGRARGRRRLGSGMPGGTGQPSPGARQEQRRGGAALSARVPRGRRGVAGGRGRAAAGRALPRPGAPLRPGV